MLADIASKSPEVNLTEVLTEIEAIQTSLDMMGDLDEAITTIESMELSVEEGDRELSDNDGRTHLFLIILIVLVAMAIVLLIVNIVLGRMGEKKDEGK